MLNSRYVHLHEALGLGVMWLKQDARVLIAQQSNSDTIVAKHQQPESSVKTSNPSAQSARLAALQQLNNINQKISKQTSSNKTQVSLNKNIPNSPPIAPLSGSLKTNQADVEHKVKMKTVRVMVLSVCASLQDLAVGKLFSGEDGILLNKMLQAIGLQNDDVLFSTWLKDMPDFNPKPPQTIVADAFWRVQQEYQNGGEPILLLLGDFFQRPEVMTYVQELGKNVRYFWIDHPMRIASNAALKRPAWTTLQKMQTALYDRLK